MARFEVIISPLLLVGRAGTERRPAVMLNNQLGAAATATYEYLVIRPAELSVSPPCVTTAAGGDGGLIDYDLVGLARQPIAAVPRDID